MRLDPKYFNVFLGVCAVLALITILVSTFYYASKQKQTFQEEISDVQIEDWRLYHYTSGDSLKLNQFEGSPIVIHFWSTWSDLSLKVNEELHKVKLSRPDLVIIAAATRDANELVTEYMENASYDFIYVEGTTIYHDLMVPGLPSQLFLNADGEITDHLVGNHPAELKKKIEQLLKQS